VKEDLTLASRRAGDQVAFTSVSQGLTFISDAEGGYVAQDAGHAGRFHILAPIAQDARGHQGPVTLELSSSSATIHLDPAFAASAAYPITVDPTVTYANTVLGDSPVAYWRLGETSGTTAGDSTGNGHTGTYAGGYTLNVLGPLVGDVDTGVLFDGTSGQMQSAGISLSASQMSVEGWVYPQNNPSHNSMYFGFRAPSDAANNFYVLQLSGTNTLEWRFRNSAGVAVTLNSAITPSSWHYVSMTYNGSTLTGYVDGVQAVSGAASGSYASSQALWVGSDP
jgi:hypothetical protein